MARIRKSKALTGSQEIAEELFHCNETIKSYRKNLLFKLNVTNTAAPVRYAIEQKLV